MVRAIAVLSSAALGASAIKLGSADSPAQSKVLQTDLAQVSAESEAESKSKAASLSAEDLAKNRPVSKVIKLLKDM